jgi:hypothetical protein
MSGIADELQITRITTEPNLFIAIWVSEAQMQNELEQKLAAANQLLREAYALIDLQESEVERARVAGLNSGMARSRLCAYRESAKLALQYKNALEQKLARQRAQATAHSVTELAERRQRVA